MGARDPGLYGNFIVVACWMQVAAVRVHHGKANSIATLHVLVFDTGSAAIFRPSDFHPDKIIRVVDYAHLIGLGITHAEARFVKRHQCIVMNVSVTRGRYSNTDVPAPR